MKKRSMFLTALGFTVLLTSLFADSASADTVKAGQFATTQQAVKASGMTIPKGTRVKITATNSNKGQQLVTIGLNRLSYKVRGLAYAGKTVTVKATNSTFKLSKTRSYDHIPVYLQRGFKPEAPSALSNPQYLNVSSDGYLEVYPILKGKLVKPSAVKITAYKYSSASKRWYLYSSSKLNGVNQKRIATRGKYQYRLTITNRNKVYKTQSESRGGIVTSHSYAVGGRYYFYSTDTGATTNL